MEYSSLSLQEVKECEDGCKVKITVGMERDQREDSVFPRKGWKGAARDKSSRIEYSIEFSTVQPATIFQS